MVHSRPKFQTPPRLEDAGIRQTSRRCTPRTHAHSRYPVNVCEIFTRQTLSINHDCIPTATCLDFPPHLMGTVSTVYAEQLLPLGHGFPLWFPEPSEQCDDVRIGDVGYIWDGCFIRLFNTMLPRSHPVNQDGVPKGYKVMKHSPKDICKRESYLAAGPLCSQTVRRTDIKLSTDIRFVRKPLWNDVLLIA